jgi:DNA-binding protein YbaB
MDPQQWLQNYQTRIDGYRRASEELKENLGKAEVTLRSPDEAVTVTVGPNGSLKNLQLSPRASEHTPAQLGALIMKTVARAQRAVAEQVVEAFAPLGANGNAMKLIGHYLPDDPDDQSGGQPVHNDFQESLDDDPLAVPSSRPSAANGGAPAPIARPRTARAADIDDDDFGGDPW